MRRWIVAALLLLCLPVVGRGQSIRYYPDSTSYTLGKTESGILYRAASANSTLLDGLVSYWPLDEISGVRYDAVGSNDLTDNNTVGFDTGVNGNAASFVAANSESLSVPLTAPSSYTLAAWVNLAGGDGDEVHLGVVASIKNGVGGCLTYASGHPDYGKSYVAFAVYTAVGPGWYLTGGWNGPPSDSSPGWQLLVAVLDDDAKTISVFVDNVQVLTSTSYSGTPGNFGAADTFIVGKQGAHPYQIADGAAWNPKVDEVAIWSRVLTADERACLYGAGTPPAYPFTGVCTP